MKESIKKYICPGCRAETCDNPPQACGGCGYVGTFQSYETFQIEGLVEELDEEFCIGDDILVQFFDGELIIRDWHKDRNTSGRSWQLPKLPAIGSDIAGWDEPPIIVICQLRPACQCERCLSGNPIWKSLDKPYYADWEEIMDRMKEVNDY